MITATLTAAPIFPVQVNGRMPTIPSAHPPGSGCHGECGRFGHGFYDATIDPQQIAAWAKEYPGCNWGMPTGEVSGEAVLDLDAKNGLDGPGWWRDQQDLHGRVDTKEIITPTGGLHLYFLQPVGVRLKSTASIIAPGVDTRTTGGFVVVPPSSIDGVPYEVVKDVPVTEMPPWLLAIWPKVGERRPTIATLKGWRPEQEPSVFAGTILQKTGSTGTSVSAGQLSSNTTTLTLPEGQRNTGLTSVAGSLWNKCGNVSELAELLLTHNQLWCVPPLDTAEVLGIVESVSRYPKNAKDTATTEFTFDEIATMLGGGIAEPFHKAGNILQEKVCRRLSSNPLAPRSTTETPTKPGDTVWNRAFELFPVIKGLAPWGKHILAINEHSQMYIAYTVYSTSWVGNAQNHNHKRRQAYAGISPKLNTWGPWYGLDVPVDDLGDDRGESRLEALQTATRRARPENGHLLAISNRIAIGCERYLSNVQHEGFIEVTDHQEWLVASLRAIRPPGKGDQVGKFYPIHGTGDIKKAAEKPADEDFNKLRSIATQENDKLDLVDVEAEARGLGLEPEHDSGRIKRAQCSDGYLKGHYTDIRVVLKLAQCFGDGRLTDYGRELAAVHQVVVARSGQECLLSSWPFPSPS